MRKSILEQILRKILNIFKVLCMVIIATVILYYIIYISHKEKFPNYMPISSKSTEPLTDKTTQTKEELLSETTEKNSAEKSITTCVSNIECVSTYTVCFQMLVTFLDDV